MTDTQEIKAERHLLVDSLNATIRNLREAGFDPSEILYAMLDIIIDAMAEDGDMDTAKELLSQLILSSITVPREEVHHDA